MTDTINGFDGKPIISPDATAGQALQQLTDSAGQEPGFITDLAGPQPVDAPDSVPAVMNEAVDVAKTMTPEVVPSINTLPNDTAGEPDPLLPVQETPKVPELPEDAITNTSSVPTTTTTQPSNPDTRYPASTTIPQKQDDSGEIPGSAGVKTTPPDSIEGASI